jgi:anti-sigma factor RsiW
MDLLRQRMQEKLDGVLSEELTRDLLRQLAEDAEAAREYARLETVDTLLGSAPQVRAPQRLAATIMARLVQTIELQARLQALPPALRSPMVQSLSLSMVAAMPMMMGAAWMTLNRQADSQALHQILEQVVVLMLLQIEAQLMLLDAVEPFLRDDPQLAAACLRLMPSMLEELLSALDQA